VEDSETRKSGREKRFNDQEKSLGGHSSVTVPSVYLKLKGANELKKNRLKGAAVASDHVGTRKKRI